MATGHHDESPRSARVRTGSARPDPRLPGVVRAGAGRGEAARTPSRWNRVGWKSILIGVLVWCVLWGKADLRTVFGGLAITWGVAVVFPLPAIRYRGRIRPWGVVRLVAVTLTDLVISSTRVALMAIDWRRPVKSAIIGVKLRTTSDLLVAMIVELVGLLPGSVVVEQVRASSRLYVHVLDVRDASQLEEATAKVRAVERRVLRAFGSDEDLALLARPVPKAGDASGAAPREQPSVHPVDRSISPMDGSEDAPYEEETR